MGGVDTIFPIVSVANFTRYAGVATTGEAATGVSAAAGDGTFSCPPSIIRLTMVGLGSTR